MCQSALLADWKTRIAHFNVNRKKIYYAIRCHIKTMASLCKIAYGMQMFIHGIQRYI